MLKEGANPLEHVGGQDERGGHDRLAACNNTLATALLVLFIVGLQSPILGVVGLLKRPVDVAEEGVLNILGLGLDDGDLLVDFGQKLVAELVGFGDVGLRVRGRGLEVWEGRLDELGVAGVGQVDGFGAIRVFLDGLDRVGDDGV